MPGKPDGGCAKDTVLLTPSVAAATNSIALTWERTVGELSGNDVYIADAITEEGRGIGYPMMEIAGRVLLDKSPLFEVVHVFVGG